MRRGKTEGASNGVIEIIMCRLIIQEVTLTDCIELIFLYDTSRFHP